jgi:elongation factor P
VPKAFQVKKGNCILVDDELWKVVDTQQTFTGKHGAYMQIKMTNVDSGHTETRRFGSSDYIEKAFIDTQHLQYLYEQEPNYVFMDPDTGEQMFIHESMLEDVLPYLAYNAEVTVQTYQGKPVNVELPSSVALEVTHTDPAVRGDTATNVTKPATVETGTTVKVPGYITKGEKISVDTRTGEFLGRA